MPILKSAWIPPQDAIPLRYDKLYPGPQWTIVCAPCQCQEPAIARQRMERILAGAGIPDDCYNRRFEEFASYADKAMVFAQAFVTENMLYEMGENQGKPGLLLFGNPGVGKTALGSLTFLHRIWAGQTGMWKKYHIFVQEARATYQDDYSGKSLVELRNDLQYAPFLMLDDLGSVSRDKLYAEDVIEMLFVIFDHRLAKRLPTLITSNLTPEQIEQQFGAPIASRLRGLCHPILMARADFRK